MEKTLKIIHEMLYDADILDTESDSKYLETLEKIDKKYKQIRNLISSEPLHKNIIKELEELENLYVKQNEYYSFIDFKSSFFCGIYIGMQLEKNKNTEWDTILKLLENDF
ncbi:hypothetical protein [Candidatus Stoquefichus massiliensis]|uniref:hypothetical protein n=1 Tax=Candidatus Stoquefichus massiliensis TaxID=1470350 RepID=UPI0004851179|nr:hypothetical protein [Candidatus Stoquefichus massiliensis]